MAAASSVSTDIAERGILGLFGSVSGSDLEDMLSADLLCVDHHSFGKSWSDLFGTILPDDSKPDEDSGDTSSTTVSVQLSLHPPGQV